MHELSIVMNIISIAEHEMTKSGAASIDEIELDIGQFSTVEMQAFDFAWQQAVKGTVLEKTSRKINLIPAKGRCGECNTEFMMNDWCDACPNCSRYAPELLQGRELHVKRMIVH
ncbi:MAG TPA: hydrogenase maturation nickel metallochaperone HypA [Chitinophagaceae bacterium]